MPDVSSNNDSIILEGLTFYGYHGVNPEERGLGQRFAVDIQVYLDLSKAGRSDAVQDSVNYTQIYRTAESVLVNETYYLLEAVAHNLAQRLLTSFSIAAVRVRVKKLSPPIRGSVEGSVGVEIYREQGRASQ